MTYALRYTPEAQEGLQQLAHAGLKHLTEKTLLRIAADPFQSKRLIGQLSGIYAARITRRFRVLYTISPTDRTVVIIDIAHRRDVYR